MSWQDKYMDRFYRSRPDWIDGTEQFHRLCAQCVPPRGSILEIGAGPSNATSRFLASLGELHGIDPSPEVEQNDALKTAIVLRGNDFPFKDESFDVCVSNYVNEHIPDPEKHLAEVHRVLKPGGAYVFRTPNRLHYVALVAGSTPHWFHELVANRLRNLSDEAHDPYPTLYRMNTDSAIRKLAAKARFRIEKIEYVEKEPSYGKIAKPIFLALMAYERLVNFDDALAVGRANIFGILRKEEAT